MSDDTTPDEERLEKEDTADPPADGDELEPIWPVMDLTPD